MDPQALAEVIALIDEYLTQGGIGFDDDRLIAAREMLEDLSLS